MHLFLGILVGIGLTIGAAYVHDSFTVGSANVARASADERLVNWDNVRERTRSASAAVREQWVKVTVR